MNTLSIQAQKNPWLAVAIVGGVLYIIGQLISAQAQKAISPAENREITITGTGEVQIKPDVARITLGVTTGPQPTAKQASDLLAQKFTAVVAAVKQNGVQEDDVKTTNLSINPIYDYPNGGQVLRGFEASESIDIKIRDLSKVGDIIAATTAQGVNQAGGIMFTVDKPEAQKAEAEKKAIEDVRQKAGELAKSLGVTLGSVKYYSASSSTPGNPEPLYRQDAVGLGGGAPSIPVPSGTQTITSTVTITYQLK